MREIDRAAGVLSREEIRDTVLAALEDECLRRVLLLPPDITRYHSGAGEITQVCYDHFSRQGIPVDIMPAIGTHQPMTPAQWRTMYGDIPYDRMIVHRWRSGLTALGTVPAEFAAGATEGLWDRPIRAEINSRVVSGEYGLILSIGQVVPHEVVGMSNHAKNLFVGVGGPEMINATHMISAVYGIERIMGRDHTPVRAIFDWAFEHYLAALPIAFIQTVTTVAEDGGIQTHGIFCGRGRRSFEAAVRCAERHNVTRVERPVRKCVAYLDPEEFTTTWLGNKAVYRTRMVIADGGELIILAPGLRGFGEDPAIDRLIRKYGYRGRDVILRQLERPENEDLRANMSGTAHMIHGSSEGRFRITYAVPEAMREAVESVGYASAPYEELIRRYPPGRMKDGWNRLPDGEEIYYISKPAIGLWML